MVYIMSQCLGDCDVTVRGYVQENISVGIDPDEYSTSTKFEIDQCHLFV